MPDIDGISQAIADDVKSLIDDNAELIINSARNTPEKPFSIPAGDINDVIKKARSENEKLIGEIYDEFNNPEIKAQGRKALQERNKKTEFYIRKLINDSIYGIHSSVVADQILDQDRDEEIEKALAKNLRKVDNVIESETATTVALVSAQIALSNGFSYYRYLTSEDEVVRSAHSDRQDKVFAYGKERVVDDLPGRANNCRCVSAALTLEEALQGEFYYPEDRPDIQNSPNSETINKSVKSDNMKNFNIQASGGVVTIDIIGEISFWEGNDFQSVKERIQDSITSASDTINVNITSHGGDAYDGLAIHDYLKGLKNTVNAHVIGYADSAASIIICAADYVTASPSSTFLIHQARSCSCSCDTAEELGDIKHDVETINNLIVDAYKKKTKKSKAEIKDEIMNEKSMTAKQALSFGLIDKISVASSAQAAKTNFQEGAIMAVNEGKEPVQDVQELIEKVAELTAQNQILSKQVEDLQSSDTKAEIEAQVRAEMKAEQGRVESIIAEMSELGIEISGSSEQEVLIAALKEMGADVAVDTEGNIRTIYDAGRGVFAKSAPKRQVAEINNVNDEPEDDGFESMMKVINGGR